MVYLSATDFAIVRADENSEIVFNEREGRFGKFVAICDGFGTIEVARPSQEGRGMNLHYTCPKRKCRHVWSRKSDIVDNSDCPKCGTTDLNPVDLDK